MSERDPEQAFNQIVVHERRAEMLRIETPPWEIAATDGISGLPAQRQHMTQAAAQGVCGLLLSEAAYRNVLFMPTFSTIVNMAHWQEHRVPTGQRDLDTLINDAAFLVGHFPDPGDMLKLREQMEYNAEQRGDLAMHQEFIRMVHEVPSFRRGLTEPVADELESYAQASLHPARRHHAFECVLDVVYGKRYEFFREMPELT